ncbi:MAG TPA: twin-arginine translocase TatA/TatE family subunit [Actinomycetota bacterium]
MNLGVPELLMVLAVALLVFGPKRLPEIARNLGKAWRTFQVESQKATAVLREGLEEAKAELPDVGSIADEVRGLKKDLATDLDTLAERPSPRLDAAAAEHEDT